MKKTIFAVALLSCLCASGLFSQGVSMTQKKLPFKKGVNLPVWLEYSRLNTLLYGKKDFENLKSIGVEAVRIPVWFDVWSDKDNDYLVSDECFGILDKAVKWCEELGLYIIIDFHNNTSGGSKTNPKIEKVLLKIWPQVAKRYKDRGSRVIYEVMNEPHFESGNLQADLSRWGKIQGKVVEEIRAVDKRHSIIVGGGDWNSLESMLKLPDYKDNNLIYNFHDYTPFLFTHQGASWTYTARIKGVPFPCDKDRMPSLPNNPTDAEKWILANYEQASSENVLQEPLDRAVDFANKRKAALMCNEFGVLMTCADPKERVNWYKLKCGWMDQRGISRISWDYTAEFGLFKSPSECRFPENLNVPLLKAMGYNVPEMKKSETWFEAAKKSGDYTIYQDGSAGLIKVETFNCEGSFATRSKDSDSRFIYLRDLEPYSEIKFLFQEACDFTSLVQSGANLEFYIKTRDKSIDLTVYFRDMESRIFPWRAAANVRGNLAKPDNAWHKVSIPLRSFADVGGWSEKTQWKNSEKKFTWSLVDALVFGNGKYQSAEGYSVKDIKIVK